MNKLNTLQTINLKTNEIKESLSFLIIFFTIYAQITSPRLPTSPRASRRLPRPAPQPRQPRIDLQRPKRQILNLTITEAKVIFQNNPSIVRILDRLISVGLGSEARPGDRDPLRQRSAADQAQPRARQAIHRQDPLPLDEPTTGLHSEDIQLQLLLLVDKGNTMVIIEHNQDVIKNADYLIDLDPEAGGAGRPARLRRAPRRDCHPPDFLHRAVSSTVFRALSLINFPRLPLNANWYRVPKSRKH